MTNCCRFDSLVLACGLLTVAVSPLGVSTLTAQKWQLPVRGVVFYERQRSGGGGLPRVGGVTMPAILLAGELDRTRRFVELPPADARDLPAWLAFDLRIKGKFKRQVQTIHGASGIQILGKGSRVGADGVQTIEAKLIAKDVGPAGMRPWAGTPVQITGTITIRRTIDVEKGVVRSFTSEFRAQLSGGGGGRDGRGRDGRGRDGRGRDGGRGDSGSTSEVHLSETWRLDRVERNRQPAFRTRVSNAIRLGTDYVKERLPIGDHGRGVVGTGVDTGTGTLALCLLTLIKADVDPKDQTVIAGFESLRRRQLTDTYSLSVALMAMEALYAPRGERDLLIEGRIKAPLPRQVPDRDMALMKEWTSRLLENFDIRQRRAYRLRFNYVSGVKRYDNSNSQYALLGLYSAHLCKVPISPTVWFASAQHWLADQTEEKRVAVRLSTTSHRDYQKIRDRQAAARRAAVDSSSGSGRRTVTSGGSRRTVSGRKTPVAGWPYVKRSGHGGRGTRGGGGRGGPAKPMGMPNTASMTTAGLTGITITQAVLRGLRKGRELQGKLEQAKRAGLAWMLHEFSVRTNKNNGRHLHYYLYGLERACEINQVALLGPRDWYFEGANILIETQNRGRGRRAGSFRGAGLAQTCMAILFLKQSAPPMPAITGGR